VTVTWRKPIQAAPGTPFGVAGPHWSSGYHTGQDFPAPEGTPVTAAADGRVAVAGANSDTWAGNHVVIEHGGGLQSWYCHLSRVQVPKGAQVRAGDLIGNVGETGNAFGFHLHFEIRKDGTPVDPMPYISGHPAPSSPTYPEPDAGIISAGLDALNPFDDIARNVGHVILLGVFVAGGVALVLAGAAVALQPAREKARGVALDALSVIPETAAIANAAKATKGA
jgi:hypothetical protein